MKIDSQAARKQYLRMTQTPVQPLILRLSVPTICSMLITSFYNMADTYFVARIGTSAAGAVGVVFSLMAIIQAVGFMLGMGSGSIASRRLGEENNEEACRSASTAWFTALILGSLITVVGLTWTDSLLRLLGSTETILPYARAYARWIVLGAPIMATSFVMNNLLRAEGKTFFSMIGIGTGGLLNVILDPIFIFGLDLGIAGAAIATIISQCISFMILLSHYLCGRTVLRLNVKHVSKNIHLYSLILRTGLPTLLRQTLNSISVVTLNVSASVYGDAALASMAIVMRVSMFINSALLGFGQGFQPVSGYNYGAHRYDRVADAFKFCVRTSTIVFSVLTVVFVIYAPHVIAFFQKTDPAVATIGTLAFRAHCATLFLFPCPILTDMLYQSTGKYRQSSFLAATRRGLFFIPLVYILPKYIGLLGIQLAQPIADVISFFISVPMAVSYIRWLRAQPILAASDTRRVKNA